MLDHDSVVVLSLSPASPSLTCDFLSGDLDVAGVNGSSIRSTLSNPPPLVPICGLTFSSLLDFGRLLVTLRDAEGVGVVVLLRNTEAVDDDSLPVGLVCLGDTNGVCNGVCDGLTKGLPISSSSVPVERYDNDNDPVGDR